MLVLVQFLLVSPAYRHFLCHLQLLQWGFGCHLWTSSFSWDSAFMVRDADSSVDIQVWTIWASTDTILCLVGFSSSFFVGSGLLKVYHTILRSEPSNISSSSQPPSPRRHQNMQQKKNVVWSHECNVPIIPFHANVLWDFWLEICHEIHHVTSWSEFYQCTSNRLFENAKKIY